MELFKLIEGKNPPAGTSRYYISKDIPLDLGCINALKQINQNNKYCGLCLKKDFVDNKETQWIIELFCAIQHKPYKVIEHNLGMFMLIVQNEEGKSVMDETGISQYYYKDTKQYAEWIGLLYDILPFICYYFNDPVDIMQFILGEGGRNDIKMDKSGERRHLEINYSPEEIIRFNERIFYSSKLFMEYCKTANVNSEVPINGMIDKLNLNFTFQDVRVSYDEMVSKGYEIQFSLPDAISDMNNKDESMAYKRSLNKTGDWLVDRKMKMMKDDDPEIEEFKGFDKYKTGRSTGVQLHIPIHTITSKDPGSFLGSLMVIQHYPESLLNLTKSFTFDIIDDNINNQIVNKKWKPTAYYKDWLFTANSFFPPAFFFMKELDDRYYALVGTEIEKDTYIPGQIKEKGILGKKFTLKQLKFIDERAFDGCVNFMQYCDAANVDCRQTIKDMIITMSFQFTYTDVLKAYERGPTKKIIN